MKTLRNLRRVGRGKNEAIGKQRNPAVGTNAVGENKKKPAQRSQLPEGSELLPPGCGPVSSAVFWAPGFSGAAHAQAAPSTTNPVRDPVKPLEFGLLVQGGKGFTQDRDAFKFIMAGVHAGKVLTPNVGSGLLRGNFEYAVEAFPFWQSYTPRFQRANCVAVPNSTSISCSPLYTVGGTFTGASITPIILRWNSAGTRRFAPWAQAAGGIIWTNHKYPAFGS